jgi:hypothetical protein
VRFLLAGLTMYFLSWIGQRNPRGNSLELSAPLWLTILLVRRGPKAYFYPGLGQLGAIGFMAGVICGTILGVPTSELPMWGITAGWSAAAILGLAWYVSLRRKAT